jgi:hypothetical protein
MQNFPLNDVISILKYALCARRNVWETTDKPGFFELGPKETLVPLHFMKNLIPSWSLAQNSVCVLFFSSSSFLYSDEWNCHKLPQRYFNSLTTKKLRNQYVLIL